MLIDLKEIICLQKELDENIYRKHNLTQQETINKKRLALVVELSEMINVNKCFKFWSVNKEYDRQKLGDEFVDCLHFILSLSLFYKLEETKFNITEIEYNNEELTNKVLELIKISTSINSDKDCQIVIIKLFELCKSFGFTWNDVLTFYKKKNNINHQRQKDNY